MRPADLEQFRDHEECGARSEVDGEIKPNVDARQQACVGGAKLVSDVRRNTTFNPARSNRDEEQSEKEPQPCRVEGESEMPEAVNDREADDRAVLSPSEIGENRSEQRGDVDRPDEEMKPAVGLMFRHRRQRAAAGEQLRRHERHKYAAHAIKAEPFGRFISDDERNARRHPVGVQRGFAIDTHGAVSHSQIRFRRQNGAHLAAVI